METMNLRYVEISVPTNVELKLKILLNPKKHPNKPWQDCWDGSGLKHSICTVPFFVLYNGN